MSAKWHIVLILGVSILTHFVFFGHPNETVFDEVHFGKFISGYYTGEYYFDIHPPLGKLMIAGFAKLFDFKPGFSFAKIGEKFPDKKYTALRFLPNLAGTLLPLVIYLLILELGIPKIAALAGGLLMTIENAILVQSQYILMDALLLLFGFLCILSYLRYRNGRSKYYLLSIGAFGGLAASIKWTGLTFLALPIIWEGLRALRSFSWLKIKKWIAKTALVGFLALIAYSFFFLIHISILNRSGTGDAFMSPEFQKTLQGNTHEQNPNISALSLPKKIIELNEQMYKANKRLSSGHPYSSAWYTWPLMLRPIYYWVNEGSRIYLIGDPAIWWASTVAVLYAVLRILYLVLRRADTKYKIQNTLYFLSAGYIINLLPFLGIKRVMFLYHYLTAYIFAILILVWLISQSKNSKAIFATLLGVSAVLFIYFAPLTYGLNLSPKAYEDRVWFESWR